MVLGFGGRGRYLLRFGGIGLLERFGRSGVGVGFEFF